MRTNENSRSTADDGITLRVFMFACDGNRGNAPKRPTVKRGRCLICASRQKNINFFGLSTQIFITVGAFPLFL